jgi:hypothetical protein
VRIVGKMSHHLAPIMNYSFGDFRRHLEKWKDFMGLMEVRVESETLQLFNLAAPISDIRRKQLRISNMLIAEECSRDEIEFRVPRFFLMHTYLMNHEPEFRRLGFFILKDDGGKEIVPAKLIRAVHETFRGALPMGIHATPPQEIANLANSYPPEWIYD